MNHGFANDDTYKAVLCLANDERLYQLVVGRNASRFKDIAHMYTDLPVATVNWQEVADHINEGINQ